MQTYNYHLYYLVIMIEIAKKNNFASIIECIHIFSLAVPSYFNSL
jgi:hypothetical protein